MQFLCFSLNFWVKFKTGLAMEKTILHITACVFVFCVAVFFCICICVIYVVKECVYELINSLWNQAVAVVNIHIVCVCVYCICVYLCWCILKTVRIWVDWQCMRAGSDRPPASASWSPAQGELTTSEHTIQVQICLGFRFKYKLIQLSWPHQSTSYEYKRCKSPWFPE